VSYLVDAEFAVFQSPLLAYLTLTHCGLSDVGLSGLKFPLLTELRLVVCHGITGAGFAALKCPLLASLELLCCTGLTDAGLVGLQFRQLAYLDLSDCSRLSNAGLAALNCPLLTTLNLSNCSKISVPSTIKDAQEKLRYAREEHQNSLLNEQSEGA
jgi:hypothetical protein